jgi:hypothetical protein
MPFRKVNTLANQKSQQMVICEIKDDYLVCAFSGVNPAKEKNAGGEISPIDGSCGCDQNNDPYFVDEVEQANKCVSNRGMWNQNFTYNEKDVIKFGSNCYSGAAGINQLKGESPNDTDVWEKCNCSTDSKQGGFRCYAKDPWDVAKKYNYGDTTKHIGICWVLAKDLMSVKYEPPPEAKTTTEPGTSNDIKSWSKCDSCVDDLDTIRGNDWQNVQGLNLDDFDDCGKDSVTWGYNQYSIGDTVNYKGVCYELVKSIKDTRKEPDDKEGYWTPCKCKTTPDPTHNKDVKLCVKFIKYLDDGKYYGDWPNEKKPSPKPAANNFRYPKEIFGSYTYLESKKTHVKDSYDSPQGDCQSTDPFPFFNFPKSPGGGGALEPWQIIMSPLMHPLKAEGITALQDSRYTIDATSDDPNIGRFLEVEVFKITPERPDAGCPFGDDDDPPDPTVDVPEYVCIKCTDGSKEEVTKKMKLTPSNKSYNIHGVRDCEEFGFEENTCPEGVLNLSLVNAGESSEAWSTTVHRVPDGKKKASDAVAYTYFKKENPKKVVGKYIFKAFGKQTAVKSCNEIEVIECKVDEAWPPSGPTGPTGPTFEIDKCNGENMVYVEVSKPHALRKNPFEGKTVDGVTYTYDAKGKRVANYSEESERCTEGEHVEKIYPLYHIGDAIWVSKLAAKQGEEGHQLETPDGEANFFIDENRDARKWIDDCGKGGGGGSIWV